MWHRAFGMAFNKRFANVFYSFTSENVGKIVCKKSIDFHIKRKTKAIIYTINIFDCVLFYCSFFVTPASNRLVTIIIFFPTQTSKAINSYNIYEII